MINFFKRLINFLFKNITFYSLGSRERMFYEMISFRKNMQRYDIEFGDYLEFGVYEGDATLAFYKALKIFKLQNKINFYLFDSFIGLPKNKIQEDSHPNWSEGVFDVGGVNNFKEIILKKGIKNNNINIIDGFFEDSLTKFKKNINPGIVNIDCDYYSSTVNVLSFLKNKLSSGTLIYFDDIHSFFGNPKKGMLAAIREFNENNNNIGIEPCPNFSGKYMNRIFWVWRD